MNNDMDAQFLCKDCSRFNQCQYYDRRKEDSYICKYFHLVETYGMTNGDVIKALFPYVKTEDILPGATVMGTNLDKGYVPFQKKWWNAPYQKRGGEE